MNSDDQLAQDQATHLRRQVKEFLKLFDGMLESITDEMMDAVHVQAGGLEIQIDTIPMRAVAEIIRQLNMLPGKPPTIPLMPLVHAAI